MKLNYFHFIIRHNQSHTFVKYYKGMRLYQNWESEIIGLI